MKTQQIFVFVLVLSICQWSVLGVPTDAIPQATTPTPTPAITPTPTPITLEQVLLNNITKIHEEINSSINELNTYLNQSIIIQSLQELLKPKGVIVGNMLESLQNNQSIIIQSIQELLKPKGVIVKNMLESLQNNQSTPTPTPTPTTTPTPTPTPTPITLEQELLNNITKIYEKLNSSINELNTYLNQTTTKIAEALDVTKTAIEDLVNKMTELTRSIQQQQTTTQKPLDGFSWASYLAGTVIFICGILVTIVIFAAVYGSRRMSQIGQ